MRASAKALQRHAQGWLWLSVLLAPILALAGGLGFQLAGFAIGVSAFLVWSSDRVGAHFLRAFWPIAIIAFVVWAWVSMLWSPYDSPFFGGNASLLFGLLIPLLFVPLVFLRLSERSKQTVVWAVILTSWLGIILLIIDSATGYALSLWADPVNPDQELAWRLGQAEMNVGRGQISYAQLLWPVAGFLVAKWRSGWIFAGLGFLALAFSAYLNNLSIILPTLVLSGVFAAIAWRNPRLGIVLAFSLAIMSLFFAPLIGWVSGFFNVDQLQNLPLSWEHRLRMWAYSWDLIRQAPIVGHGFDAARSFDELSFRARDGHEILVMSMHPHNIGLQIWLETGLIGVILGVGFLFSLMKSVLAYDLSYAQSFATAGLIVTIAVSGAATIGVWQHWWWALIVFAASLIILVPKKT